MNFGIIACKDIMSASWQLITWADGTRSYCERGVRIVDAQPLAPRVRVPRLRRGGRRSCSTCKHVRCTCGCAFCHAPRQHCKCRGEVAPVALESNYVHHNAWHLAIGSIGKA